MQGGHNKKKNSLGLTNLTISHVDGIVLSDSKIITITVTNANANAV